jgi:DNA-directed RNA polymerase subunit RPC12/RpoP
MTESANYHRNAAALGKTLRGWVNTIMRCHKCSEKFVATHHTDTKGLECPNCGTMVLASSGERQ